MLMLYILNNITFLKFVNISHIYMLVLPEIYSINTQQFKKSQVFVQFCPIKQTAYEQWVEFPTEISVPFSAENCRKFFSGRKGRRKPQVRRKKLIFRQNISAGNSFLSDLWRDHEETFTKYIKPNRIGEPCMHGLLTSERREVRILKS